MEDNYFDNKKTTTTYLPGHNAKNNHPKDQTCAICELGMSYDTYFDKKYHQLTYEEAKKIDDVMWKATHGTYQEWTDWEIARKWLKDHTTYIS